MAPSIVFIKIARIIAAVIGSLFAMSLAVVKGGRSAPAASDSQVIED